MTGDPATEVTPSFYKETTGWATLGQEWATSGQGWATLQQGLARLVQGLATLQPSSLEEGTTMFKSLLSGSVTTPLCLASRHRSPLVSCTSSSRTSSGHLAISRMALGDTLSRVNYLIPPNVMLMLSSPLLLPFTLNHLKIDIYVK